MGPYYIEKKQELDLGVVTMDRKTLEVFAGILMDGDNRPASKGTQLYCEDDCTNTDDEGRFALRIDPDETYDLIIKEKGKKGGMQMIRFRARDLEPETEAVLKMLPWCDLHIQMQGIPYEHRFIQHKAAVEPDRNIDWYYDSYTRSHSRFFLSRNPSADSGNFHFRVGPGRYLLDITGLYKVSDYEFEIKAGERTKNISVTF